MRVRDSRSDRIDEMNLPFRFPDPQDEARKRAEEFQRLPPDERLRELMDTIDTGLVLIRMSPNREVIDRLTKQREQEWQNIQQELFRRYAR
jgi:hypothetical protein